MDTACTLFYSFMWARQIFWARFANQTITFLRLTFQCLWYPLSHRIDCLFELSFYYRWWVSGGWLLFGTIRPHFCTYHSPSRHQYSHDPLKLSYIGQARPIQLCIINTLNKKKGSQHGDLGFPLSQTVLKASSRARLFEREAADWQSISGLAVALKLKRTTDKDILANEDNSAGPSYLFAPVCFI